MHALYYIYMYMYALLKARGRNKQFFEDCGWSVSYRANMNKILQWDLDNKQMGKMPAFSLIYCTKPLNASTRLDYTLFWVNILKDLCYVIFRKVYTYMAWTEICYICWLFLPSYIIFFLQISSFSLFLCLSLIFSIRLACFFTYANNTFFHSIPSYYGNSLLVFMERLTEIPQLSSYRTRPWSIKFIYPIRQL